MKSPWKERETVNVREGGVGRVRKFPAVFPDDSFISWSVGQAFGRSVGQANPIYGRRRQNEVNELSAEWWHDSCPEEFAVALSVSKCYTHGWTFMETISLPQNKGE